MKKVITILLIAAMSLMSITALAEKTYSNDDIAFRYDEAAFEVSFEDQTDDETTVVLSGKNEAWGQTYIRFYLADLEDGETFPTMEEFMPIADVEVTQGEWNGFKDVFMYNVENDDGTSQYFFIAPVVDDDGEVEEVLTVEVGITAIEDDGVAMGRDDQISAVIDSLTLDD